VRLTRYSAIEPGSGKPCDQKNEALTPLAISGNEALTLLGPSANPDGCQQLAEGHALVHRPRALAVCLGIYICAAVLGWGLIDVALAVWLP
jgi:hypothetical protein